VIDASPAVDHPSPPVPPEPAMIEISLGPATVRVRGAVDAKTLAAVLKALKVLR
jgi:hypothetical protein